ncbi:MAG: ATP-dependent DNA helicase [Candidatus Diapherotrites archaeon]
MLPSSIPFRYAQPREGQEKMIMDAQRAFQKGKIFLAHAETGLGKTDASLSAALSVALSTSTKKTIIFLTPKNAQHAIALETLKEINQKFGLNIRAVDLVGKKHTCLEETVSQKEGRAFYEGCKRRKEREACTFYKNVRGHNPLQREKAKIFREAFMEQNKKIHTAMEIKENAARFAIEGIETSLCPYEISMDMAKKADVIVADYYHIFSPSVSELVLPKLGKKPENCILIIDEAHNLPDRVRGLMSTSLNTKQLQKAQDEAHYLKNEELETFLFKAEKNIEKETKKILKKEKLLTQEEWKKILSEKEENWEDIGLWCQTEGVRYLEKSGKENAALIALGEFFEKWEQDGTGYARILKKWDNEIDSSLMLRALDPSPLTQTILGKMHSALLMSGTLYPLPMYADILGIPNERVEMEFYASPFPKENRLNLISTKYTTKFTERNEMQYILMAEELGKIVNQIPGNTVVYFPSFTMLDNIGRKMRDTTLRQMLFQKENMRMHDTQKLIGEFRQHSRGFGSVLLACTSGSMAEGLDFPGNELLGVIIVGVPLAEMNVETQALIDYYEKRFNKGWEYGYIFPAMGKAVQAAGRLIRTPTDAGIVVFMDKRYTWNNYKGCLPPTQEYHPTNEPSIKVKEFWQGKKG